MEWTSVKDSQRSPVGSYERDMSQRAARIAAQSACPFGGRTSCAGRSLIEFATLDIHARILFVSGKIDNPVDASLDAYPEEPNGVGAKFAELSLSLTSLIFPPAAVLKILTDQFGRSNRLERIEYLLQALNLGLKGLESQMGTDRQKMKEIEERIQTPRFQEAVATACEEVARATSRKTVDRLAQVLVGSVKPTRWSPKDEDIAALIRDIAQLGDRDIEVLEKLGLAFGGLMLTNAELPHKLFTDNNNALDRIVGAEADRDEFYSTCGRLMGFGLAVEEQWPINHTAPHERCIRPTRRGLALLGYLKKFAS